MASGRQNEGPLPTEPSFQPNWAFNNTRSSVLHNTIGNERNEVCKVFVPRGQIYAGNTLKAVVCGIGGNLISLVFVVF